MKKIAILTQPLGHNYGGIIQNYALQFVLKNKGYDVITILREYTNYFYLRTFLSIIKNETYNRIKGCRRKILSNVEKTYIFSEMYRFMQQNIDTSEKIYSSQSLTQYFEDKDFDIVVIGSDQTWRPKYSPNIYNYFLDFLEKNRRIKKIAYASSFGTEEWEYTEIETEKCKNLVKQFDAVSVREASGVDLCKNYLDIDAEWVLDPTLLLNQHDYIALFKNIDSKQQGLFSYVLDKDSQKQQFINSVAEDLKLEVYSNQPKKSLAELTNFSSLDDYKFPSLEGWIKSFYDADFVITDSFHGTVFSIIFNKPFITIVNEARGASRFHSLLNLLGLENRLISKIDNSNTSLDVLKIRYEINYDIINKKLEALRLESLNFLKNNLA